LRNSNYPVCGACHAVVDKDRAKELNLTFGAVMAYPILTTGSIMDASASLLNDTAKSRFTYTIQLPYLNMALQELQEMFELNEIPTTATTSAALTVVAGLDHIGFVAQGSLVLPDDFIEPQQLWERTTGINPYIPMHKVDVLPRYMEGTTIPQLMFYTWESQEIRFLGCKCK